MQILVSDLSTDFASLLNGYDCPAILVTPDYRIMATNDAYEASFGSLNRDSPAFCYRVSHGYDVPCDQAGEDCPLAAATESGTRQRVLHIHQTPRGREHVDVEMLPIHDEQGGLRFFVELLKPVSGVGAENLEQNMIGRSPAFNRVVEDITRVGPTEASVLLLGESGTGKELAARAIHEASPRREKALVTLECAGLTSSLFESELFGYVKGAFTGAHYNRRGLVESADGGTLFLDEIADVPFELQVKLLRLIETGTYRPVGSSETRRSDFRLICATHQDIARLVEEGGFRRDLYYRINVFPIHLPDLHERREDIPLLARAILGKLDESQRYVLTDSAIRLLREHEYRGNIRELRNVLARAMVLSDTHVIDGHVIRRCLEIDRGSGRPVAPPPLVDLKTQERRYLQQLLAHCDGDKQEAAAIAGISLRSLYRRLDSNHDH